MIWQRGKGTHPPSIRETAFDYPHCGDVPSVVCMMTKSNFKSSFLGLQYMSQNKKDRNSCKIYGHNSGLLFPLLRKCMLLVAIIVVLLCIGCAPTLNHYLIEGHVAWYVPPEYVIELKLPRAEPLTQDPIPAKFVVTDFQDNRPFAEKFNGWNAFRQTVISIVTLGMGFLVQINEDSRYQPFGDLDKDVPKLLVDYIKKSKLFTNTVYKPSGSGLYVDPDKDLTWLKKQNCDYVLVGRINHFTGHWQTGGMVSRYESPEWQDLRVTTEWNSLNEIFGYISLSLKIVDAKSGKEVWNKDVDFRDNYEKSIFMHITHDETIVKNELSARAFCSLLPVLTESLKDFFCDKELGGNVDQ
jgi:hypothetical protein